MTRNLDKIRIAHPSFLLLYSPLQFAPEEMAKPDGSLSLPYIAGALRRAGYAVRILDCSVGGEEDSLENTFFRSTLMSNGLLRVGLSRERIVEVVSDYDVIAISSIFTAQTSMVLETVRVIKQAYPQKLMIAGGVNARNLRDRFFAAGVDVICLSEAETTIVQIGESLRGSGELTSVPGIAYLHQSGREVVNRPGPVLTDLNQLPMPAWDLLPLDKYWTISRPHGGQFPEGKRIQYASLQTSRGCPFQCLYCHISKEEDEGISGAVGAFRMKSLDRVILELNTLKSLGAQHIFFEDDSLFAKKKRAYELFRLVRELGLHLSDVNGVNVCHLQKNYGGSVGVDIEFLEVLAEAGFNFLHLPFESASQRLLDRYSTGKWTIAKTDSNGLIEACNEVGIKTAGNYMIGYPDETATEIFNTILMAKRHVEHGLNHAALFTVVPFPGTILFDMVIANGQLEPDFDTDQMKWTRSILKNLAIPADTLEHMRQLAWLTVNRSEFVDYKLAMRVSLPETRMSPMIEPVAKMGPAIL
jgi:radical SAM superfamily enzyme YgiQ (UPF0313 family)